MAANNLQLALVENGEIFLWAQPDHPAELSEDPPYVGHPRRPLRAPGGARCGLVTELGPEGHASFTIVTDPVQTLMVEALFELRRKS
ncbi:MAG: hypothetical protein CVU57_20905 [Deltaproteobacteria bacterium HGW-Deltaproteobacteria-15]|jgi:hypothetical protein|nr:MAG: hypothetical protein CVU57_20905 [Deltaproteobacteria bacterium HGW-Deltaproteobacteria-15]PKN99379.1 MAG: hypothetical protein CVU43_15270 [Chloroflexi bacterium HGW-Chloroflexi-5]